MRKPELLVPASSLEVLKIATVFGADAVYIGGEAFGLRAKARNFSKEEMAQGIAFAHEHGVKVYVTVNILAHNYDLAGVREYLKELKELKPDALIIEFSVNDAVTRFDISPEQSIKNTDYMIRKVREQNPKAEVILLVVATHPLDKCAEDRPNLQSYIKGYHTLADKYRLQIIDFTPVWDKVIEEKGEKAFRHYLHDGMHSTKLGALEMIAPKVIEALKTGK